MLSFSGSIHGFSQIRKDMLNISFEAAAKYGFKFTHYVGGDWKNLKRATAFNLAPRGYGRSSFHTYELVQMGFIPIYLYDDHEWLPYRGSKAFLGKFAWSLSIEQYKEWIDRVGRDFQSNKSLNLEARRREMLQVRSSHYTYEGTLDQIEYFLRSDPSGDLSCQRHPRKAVAPQGVDDDL